MSKRSTALVLTGISILLLIAVVLSWVLFSPITSGSKGELHILKIRWGSSFDTVVDLMLETGIIPNRAKLQLSAKILGWRDKLKAGKYEIPAGISSYRLLKILVEGKVAIDWVTIPEGRRARQIASILREKIEIDSTRFMQLVNDSLYTRKLGIEAQRLEGFLFPDTYGFYWGMKSEVIIPVLVNQFKKHFSDSLRARAEELGFTILEVVTLASIIEGEAIVDSERPLISAVYHNRLKKGMRLQADPTIQYILQGGPRRLLNRDLKIDSPYNTYKYPGLPPGPVNNPGIASIEASLYPADVDYLYFVAKGDGSHVFSVTWQEHLKAKSQFDKYRREVRQKHWKGNNGREG